MFRQRVYQIACGYEDADCDHFRSDPAFKAAVGREPRDDPDMASQPTMTRLENAVTARDLLRIGYAFVHDFIASYPLPPDFIVKSGRHHTDYLGVASSLSVLLVDNGSFTLLVVRVSTSLLLERKASRGWWYP